MHSNFKDHLDKEMETETFCYIANFHRSTKFILVILDLFCSNVLPVILVEAKKGPITRI